MSKPLYSPDFAREINSLIQRVTNLELANYKEELEEIIVWNYITAGLFQNSWVNYGTTSSDNAAAYAIDPHGFVHLRGLVKSGTVGAAIPIFTLPEGYRPFYWKHNFNVISGAGVGILTVDSDGLVCLQSGSNNPVSMDGVYFSTT